MSISKSNTCNGSICSSEHCPCADGLTSEKQDPLSRMFFLQEEFNKRVGLDSKHLQLLLEDEDEDVEYIQEIRNFWLGRMHLAMLQELSEFRDSIPWKWWKKQETDLQNAKVEVIDMFHFLISMAQILNLSPEDLLKAYEEKNKINNKRQDAGELSGSIRDPNDCRHI